MSAVLALLAPVLIGSPHSGRHTWANLSLDRIPALLKSGMFGAFVAFFSFGSVMEATRLDAVGLVAAHRETSTYLPP